MKEPVPGLVRGPIVGEISFSGLKMRQCYGIKERLRSSLSHRGPPLDGRSLDRCPVCPRICPWIRPWLVVL